MSSTIKKISPVVQELAITVPADEIKKSAEVMFANVRKSGRIKGFRKGRMPMAIAKKMFAASVYAELTSDLTYRFFMKALQEHEIAPLGEPSFTNIDSIMKEGEDYAFNVTVETAPRLDEIVTDGIVLQKKKIVAEPTVIEDELKRLQNSLATTKELETKRAIKLGDQVKLELRRREESGEWSENALPQDLALEEAQCPRELLEQLPGMNLDDEKEIVFGADRDNPMTFLVKVVDHQERVLPEIDDDFARDLGEFETIDELKADIEKKYLASLENREKDALKQKLLEALREKNAMTLPPGILAKQTAAMRGQYENIVKQVADAKKEAKGEDTEKTDEGESALDSSAQNAAAEIVHTHFLIEEIARIGEIKVTVEDIEAKYQEMADATGLPLARLKAEYADRRYASELESRILEDKVFDFILPKVTIEEIDSDSADTTETKAAAKKTTKKPATKKAAAEKSETDKKTTPKATAKKTVTKKTPAEDKE
ncbi:MAG: trigger factor [Deltaproteobacteria bacterium]|nr:trigger factor [Deltaproteobacteria bacterium]